MKRSPLLRKPSATARLTVPVFRPKRCKACKEQFTPMRSFVCWCTPACGLIAANAKLDKKRQAQAKAERKADQIKREKLKTRSDYMKEAQRAFNGFIRCRDAAQLCICCNQPLTLDAVGGGYDCGHYRSVGSAPHLRFDERNAHGQRKQCNRWGSGRAVDYRIGLIARIGRQAVDDLESDQSAKHWRAEDLIAIRDAYRTKTRELKKWKAR